VELIAAIFMLFVGAIAAVLVMTAIGIAQRETAGGGDTPLPATERERIAASLLFHLVSAGGRSADEALREIRRRAGIAAPVTRGIDVTNWAESYSRLAKPEDRSRLLETAVQLIADPGKPIPLRQYAILLDLSFGLGFHTDALAKLHEQYGFDYVDHAKAARPREADRAGGLAPLFVREPRAQSDLLRILGLTGTPSRQTIISAYRRLAAQHHPDKFHGADDAARTEASARFIELTRAYEELLLIYRD
jgi:DnaJ domain